nr:type II toxin-antitoxin system VapC family toxin [Polymorphobacter sp.]
MRAIDTNIVVRYVTGDDVGQALRVRRLVDTGDIYIPTTVILESEWVLRTAYRFGRAAIIAALRSFIGLPGVTVEDPDRLTIALDWAAEGLDLADALHLSGARNCTAFVSFDRALARAAAKLPAIAIVEP